MKPKPQTEKEITASIRTLLKAFGIFHWKVWQGLGSEKGVSDIIGMKTVKVEDLVKAGVKKVGIFTAIEAKRGDAVDCPYRCNHKICGEQAAFLDAVLIKGGIAIVARSVEDVFEGLGIENK